MTSSALSSRIVDFVSSRSGRAAGAEIGQFIKSLGEVWSSHNVNNLREFINQHVAELRPVEAKGGDVIYAIGDRSESQSSVQSENSTVGGQITSGIDRSTLWKSFSSPNAYLSVIANPETKQLCSVQRVADFQPEPPWVVLRQLSVEQHAAIARKFIESLDELSREALSEGLENGSGPASAFFKKIKDMGLESRWLQFRKNEISQLLRSALADLGISDAVVAPPRRATTPARPSPQRQLPPTNQAALSLRQLAAAVVSSMDEGDLRNMKVPLGLIFDILQK